MSVYDNGGMIGKTMDITSIDTYSGPPLPVEYVGYVHGTTNTTTNLTLTLPGTVLPTDKIFIHIVYENSTTIRPSVTGFTELHSRNGLFSGTSITQVLLEGTTSSSTITIPNNTTYGGCAVSIVILRNANTISESGINNSTNGSTSETYTRSIPNYGAFIILAGMDALNTENLQFTSWNSDANFDYNDTYLFGNGADVGRACYSGVALGPTTSITYSTGFPSPTTTTGVFHSYISVANFETTPLNYKNSGIWNLKSVYNSKIVTP